MDRALAVWDDEDLPEDALDRIETRIAFAPPAAAEPSRRSVLVPFSAGFATAATLTFALWLFAGESAAPLPAASPRAVSDVTPVPGTRVLEYVDAHNRLVETPMPPEVFEALRRQLGDAEFRAWNDRVRFAPTPVDFEAK